MSNVDSTRAAAARKPFFSALPHDLQDDHNLRPRDILTVASILRFARAKPWASMCNRTLASMGRCSERTIQLSLARLEAAGWIRRQTSDAPAAGRTGRLVYLNWRTCETHCAPPPTAVAPPPVAPIAPELKGQREKEKPAPAGSGSPGPDRQTEEARPVESSEVVDYAALGWLDRPASDPLRQIAEKALAARLAGPQRPEPTGSASPVHRPLMGPPRTLAGMLGRSLGRRD